MAGIRFRLRLWKTTQIMESVRAIAALGAEKLFRSLATRLAITHGATETAPEKTYDQKHDEDDERHLGDGSSEPRQG